MGKDKSRCDRKDQGSDDVEVLSINNSREIQTKFIDLFIMHAVTAMTCTATRTCDLRRNSVSVFYG